MKPSGKRMLAPGGAVAVREGTSPSHRSVLFGGVASIVTMMVTFLALFAQEGRPVPKFDVVSVKPYKEPSTGRTPVGGCRGTDTKNATPVPLGRCVMGRQTLRDLILLAYPPMEPLAAENAPAGAPVWPPSDRAARIRIMPMEQWVVGGPDWIGQELYSIEAAVGSPEATTQDEMRLMLQSLLADTFHLKVHREMRSVSALALVAPDGAGKLQKYLKGNSDPKVGNGAVMPQLKPFPLRLGSMTQLALVLALQLKSPVLDHTNIEGTYDFSALDGADFGLAKDGAAATNDSNSGSIFTLLEEKLGLRMEPQKLSVEVIVVDRAERPS